MEADGAQRFLDQPQALRPRRRESELAHRRREHVVDAIERVVGLVRILKNCLHLAAEFPSLSGGQLGQQAPPVSNLTFARLDEAQQQTGEGGLAAAALAHHRGDPRLVRADGEEEAFERNLAIPPENAAGEVFRDVAQLEERSHAKWHATETFSLTFRTAGLSMRQRGSAIGQRGWKAQPGGSARNSGARPEIPLSPPLRSKDGRLSMSARV